MTEAAASDNKVAGTVAVTASAAAVACGVCCVLPFALPAAMLGTFGGVFALFASAYRWMTVLAVVAVVAGWFWVLYRSRSTGKRPARSSLTIMTLATGAMILALMWPKIEGPLIAMLR